MLLDVTGSFTGTLPLPMGDSFSFDAVPGGTYTVRLRAANALASARPRIRDAVVPGPCANRPLTPVNFLAHRIGSTVYVVWDPAATGPPPPDSS